jgi:hypothetical protein
VTPRRNIREKNCFRGNRKGRSRRLRQERPFVNSQVEENYFVAGAVAAVVFFFFLSFEVFFSVVDLSAGLLAGAVWATASPIVKAARVMIAKNFFILFVSPE